MSSELSGSSFIFDSSKTLDDSCDLHSSLKCTLNGTLAFSGMKVREDLTSCDCDDDDLDSLNSQPQGERWPPLGAPNDDNTCTGPDAEFKWYSHCGENANRDRERLKELEEEQEHLNNSLLALTSHFAQVQFRLKQIVNASPEEKENLLVELEEFANRGIPDVRQNVVKSPTLEDGDAETRLDVGQERQKELIEQLKQQLEDLEYYAYQTGEAGLPQSILLQKQRVIIDQLKGKLNLKVDDFDKLTIEDLKQVVDQAVKELINPLRMKEQLVNQLQTQIVDLERFIEFLQDGGPDPVPFEEFSQDCKCEGHLQPELSNTEPQRRRNQSGRGKRSNSFNKKFEKEQMNKKTENMIQWVTTLLSMLTFAQLGCGSSGQPFERNSLKRTPSGYHWGDLRAKLEMAIANVCEIADVCLLEDANCDSDAESKGESPVISSEAITLTIRKKLCPALRDLIQHGLMPVVQSRSVVPIFSCFPQSSQKSCQILHAWDFILKYYHLKNGDQYNRTPARKLSQSFNLDITGGSAITNKQLLLQTIGSILTSHGPLKRSYDSHFKAFVSAALNKKKLNTWLRLIFRTQSLVENYYQSWSYVAKTGFEDAFRSMEQLSKYNFELPVDLALKPFHNIKDVFN
ncbi:UNVERIFIED_CONTAM: hypothetical protein RMT77_006680 [Armadillidium vulgare]